MKTITRIQMLLVMLSIATTFPAFADNAPVGNKDVKDAKTEMLTNRLKEIKEMDKSNMTRTDKKALRKEVKETKAALKASNNGVYLSVGAIIIIILILILIL